MCEHNLQIPFEEARPGINGDVKREVRVLLLPYFVLWLYLQVSENLKRKCERKRKSTYRKCSLIVFTLAKAVGVCY